ncbi:response regulator [Cohnella herbarum]|uniref:response regulator n=1 Tax=Cohnella herbarum TaxID=2728023 RepID=UPI0020C35CF6|nr:response regulator [Cohnella herbarum]
MLIVDDEPKVRRGLSSLVPKLDPEWEVVGTTTNGEEALQFVKKLLPDLVITDIRMPRMNGLDLLGELKEYPLQVVILSGYGYFEYARTAIQFGAFDFLLKPLKPEAIRDVLGRLSAQLKLAAQEPRTGVPELRYSKLWKEWMLSPDDEQGHASKLKPLIPAGAERLRIAAIDIDAFDKVISEDQWGDRQLVAFAVRNVLHELLAARSAGRFRYLYQNGSQMYYLSADESFSREFWEGAIETIARSVKISVSVGLSDESSNFEDMPSLLANARESLENKWIHGEGKVSDYRDFRLEDLLRIGYPEQLEMRIVRAIRGGDASTAYAGLEEFVLKLRESKASFRLFQRFCLQLLASLLKVSHEQKASHMVFRRMSRSTELFAREFTADEFLGFMREFVEASLQVLEWSRSQKQSRTLDKAMAYIRDNYARDISLDDVAGHVGMSSSYFSTYFKQETETSFVEFLTRLRMDAAKSLMKDTDLRLYEIAGMVGYQDVKYFSRLFKKTMNATPIEYRQFFDRKEDGNAK